jgi:hypothetical protein
MGSIKQQQNQSGGLSRMTRYLLLFSLMTAIYSAMAAEASAQTFAEWFKQNSTQKKYLLQQIAALQVFSGYLKQGYQIANTGLGSISGSLKSENGLHSTYYTRMKSPSSTVRNDDRVKEIMAWQKDILTIISNIDQISGLTTDEKTYLANVRAAVLKDCDQQITTLQSVLADGQLQMSDAERLSLIGKIHGAMLDNYRFAAGFSAQAKAYALQRQQENNEALTEKQLYSIH